MDPYEIAVQPRMKKLAEASKKNVFQILQINKVIEIVRNTRGISDVDFSDFES